MLFQRFTIGIGLILAVQACPGQEPGSLEWFRAEWDNAQRYELPERVFIDFDFATYPSMDKDAVDALAASISAFPDHPDHFRVKRERRLIELGSEIVHHRLWYWDRENWRCNEDALWEHAQFVDFGRRDGQLWANCTPQLTLTTMRSMPSDRHYDQIMAGRAELISELLFCGFATGVAVNISPTKVSLDGARWTGTAANAAGDKTVEWRGHLTDDGLILDQFVVLSDPKYPKGVGLTVTFDGWTESGVFGRPVPTHSRWVNSKGEVRFEETLREHRGLPREEFTRVARVPERGGTDAIRGKIDPGSLADFRPGKGVLVSYADPEKGVEESTVPMPHAAPVTGAGALTWAGRVLAVLVLGAGIVLIRNRRG